MYRLLHLAREEKLAASAWEHLHLHAPADLRAVCDFLHFDLIRDTLPVKGMFTRNDKGVCRVYVSDSLPFTEQRRVIAHEIGHGLSAKKLPLEVSLCYDGDEDANPVETEASAFGRCLLVPAGHLITMVTYFGHCKRNNATMKLAHHFDVDVPILERRLLECGLYCKSW